MTGLRVTETPVEGQQRYGEVFPLALVPENPDVTLDAMTDWLHDRREQLLDDLAQHGAVLLRGFPVSNHDDFDAVVRAFDLRNFTYSDSLSNAVRVNRTERVFTANEAPPSVAIYLHHEMAQTPVYPSRLFFFCEHAPEADGETPLCRSDVLLERLAKERPAFVDACERLGVRYSNVMPGEDDPESGQGRSWRSTLGTGERREAEAKLNALGYQYEWADDDTLRATTPVLPIVRTLKDGRRVFFNQLIAAFCGWQDRRNDPRKAIRFGDDSPIPVEDMQCAIDLAEDLTFDLAWQSGDVALVDNFLVMHGRRPYTGTRRVLASLVADDGSRVAA